MLTIVDKQLIPPGEFRYQQPETGFKVQTRSWSQMLQQVHSHRVANFGCDIQEGWQARLEHDYCLQNNLDGTQWCSDEKYYAPDESRPLHWSDIQRFLFSMIQWVAGGRKLVEQDEAERRAAICATCPKNVDLHVACPSCVKLDALIAETKGDRATSLDASLRNCEVCRCHNSTAVFFPLESMSNKGLNFPDHCWKLVELP
jgi:hypothetical protein